MPNTQHLKPLTRYEPLVPDPETLPEDREIPNVPPPSGDVQNQ